MTSLESKSVLILTNQREYVWGDEEIAYFASNHTKPADLSELNLEILASEQISAIESNSQFFIVVDEIDIEALPDCLVEIHRLLKPAGRSVIKLNVTGGDKTKLLKLLKSYDSVRKVVHVKENLFMILIEKDLASSSGSTLLQPDLDGTLDMIYNLEIKGWALDRNNPEVKVQLELLSNGIPVGFFVADKYRQDLADANIGDGYCSYSYPIPPQLCDGKTHELEIRERATGYVLKNMPVEFYAASDYLGEIRGLEGTSLVGWSSKSSDPYHHPIVSVYEGESLVGETQAGYGNDFSFNLPLTEKYLDGKPHAFIFKLDGNAYLGSIAVITPKQLTPWDALQKYANGNTGSTLAPIAAFRYQSLIKQLSSLCESEFQTKSTKIYDDLKRLVYSHGEVVKGYQRSVFQYAPIDFPKVKSPKVSIVIPVHNKFNLTYNCLMSLLLAANDASFEVIVVDDGSKDATIDFLSIVAGVKYTRNEIAQGFILSCNKGAKLASGDYIVMLNNDTEVTSGWLDEMLYVFTNFEQVGMVGSMLLYEDGTLQEAGGIVWETGDPWNYGRNQNASNPKFNYTRQVDYLSGASIMLPKQLWDELEGFDIEYVPAYFEDTDLAFRVRDKGYKTIYAPFSKVIHFEGKSSGTSTSSGTKRFQEINRPKFKQRWKKACKHNGAVGVNLELAKDRNVEYRALVIDAETPRPDMDAGSYAAIQEIRLLQSLGFKVTFMPENLAYMGQYTDNLQRMGVECQYAPFYSSVNEMLVNRGTEFDVVYITRYYVAEKFIEDIRQYAPNAKIIFNNADLHFLRELRSALLNNDHEQLNKAVETREKELSVMRQVDMVLSYNETEHAVIMSHNLNSTKVSLCPWVVETVNEVPSFDSREGIAFLGGFTHYPNVEAVKYFVREIMPQIRKQLPGVPFLIYGSRADEGLWDLETSDDVILKGWVKDVSEVYNTCRVFIAPLKTGAGLKGKVVGALSYGVPCVLSPVAAEGTNLSSGHEVVIAEAVEHWVSAIVDLYQDGKKWQLMSEEARAYTKRYYSFERGRFLMRKALEQVDVCF